MTVTYPVTGIDVSYANAGDLNNPDSIAFCFAKATEGTSQDARWAQHSQWALAHGKVLGAYHFGRSGSGAAQAQAFLHAVGSSTRLVALDIEGGDPISLPEARVFIAACRAAGRTVGVYHSISGFPTGLGQQYNWVAWYNGRAQAPTVPWAFWQWVGSPLDRDYYNGSEAQLRALAQLEPAPPAAKWTLHIAPRAAVTSYALAPQGCLTGTQVRQWGVAPSSAGCSAPSTKAGCSSGRASVVHVPRGAFAGRWVRIGPGVTASHA